MNSRYKDTYEIKILLCNSSIKESQKWFIFSGKLEISENLWYIIVEFRINDIWIIPSEILSKYEKQIKSQFDIKMKKVSEKNR